MLSFARIAAIILLAAIAFPAALHAQVSGGTLSGTITDPTGRAVPQAQIVITNHRYRGGEDAYHQRGWFLYPP